MHEQVAKIREETQGLESLSKGRTMADSWIRKNASLVENIALRELMKRDRVSKA